MTPRRLHPQAVPTDDAVLALLPAVQSALSGDGPALLLHATSQPPPTHLEAGGPLGADEDDDADPTALVVMTSGSSGRRKGVLLSASALLASVSATHDRLGGPGQWLLAVPAEHIAGAQVLVRSLVSRTRPVVLDLSTGFDPQAFTSAAARLTAGRRYVSLVPTQVRRLLDAGPEAMAALQTFHAVLVGGAAMPVGLRDRAREVGVHLITTYGMSETCGGCVYDGVPLDGVEVTVDPPEGGVIVLSGGVVARGYRGEATTGAFSASVSGGRRFVTADLGRLHETPQGRVLDVLGRRDDAILTGGLTVAPAAVEAVLVAMPEIAEAVVVGIDDAEWGAAVAAAVVLSHPDGGGDHLLPLVRERVGGVLGRPSAPRHLMILPTLPLRGPGKPDRDAVRLALQQRYPVDEEQH